MKKYGLIGYPLKHSFSIGYFNERFQNEGIDAEYVNYEIASIDWFESVVLNNPEIQGLNVTIPYKEQVIPFLDSLDPKTAGAVGAVNVIRVIRDGEKVKLVGFNSDIVGFTKSIEPMIAAEQHTHALILGTGGASKAVYHGLKSLGIASMFVSRNQRNDSTYTYEELTPEIMAQYKVIVNCTPVGMFPHTRECPEIPYEMLTENHILYDLIYNPSDTTFMKKGRQHGAKVKNGLEMLILQAEVSWEIWNGLHDE